MFFGKEKLIRSLSFNQSEFNEQGQKSNLFQDSGDSGRDGVPNKDDRPTEIKVAEIQAEAQIKSAEIDRISVLDRNEIDKEIAQINASAQISTAREINDPNEIDVNEFKAIDVITRNDLAGEGLEDFEKAVNNKEPAAIKDLQTLQKSLKADGKYSGPIDEDFGGGTIAGMNALISENAPAIKTYYETKQLLQANSSKPVSPKDTNIEKTVEEEIER